VLRSIFLGGGTPSLMEPETVAAVIGAARAAWPFSNDIEITMEANPTSVEAGRFRGYRAAGVNRLSLGCRRWTTGTCGRSGGSTRPRRRWRPSGSRATCSSG
jgi:oxygen-independent coproporphyrinogen-3 oxidase